MIISNLNKGLGSLIGINNIIDTSSDSDLCFKLLEPEIKTTLAIVWRKYQRLTKVIELFLEELKKLNI